MVDGKTRKNGASPPTDFGGYTLAFVEQLYALSGEGLVDVWVMDLGIVGFTRRRQVMPRLVAAGAKAPRTRGMADGIVCATQRAAGVGKIDIVEGIPGKTRPVDKSAYEMKESRLGIPENPAFGRRWKNLRSLISHRRPSPGLFP